jgi:PIN domain nuclease of toxin-antitoxin system
MMAARVLDASAIIAAVLGEPGGDDVFDMVDSALAGAVNVAEVYTYAATNGLPTDAFDVFFAETGIEVAEFDHKLAVATGVLATITRKAGLSLGDRACLAFAQARSAEVLTADRAWAQLADELGVEINLLR